MLKINIIFCLVFFFCFHVNSQTQKKYWEYPREYDYPKNVLHGTCDFDEWPGIDHPVVYKEQYFYNISRFDKFKIDYDRSFFKNNDHEGYLRNDAELESRGFIDLDKFLKTIFKDKKKIVALGIYAHPDDETILSGGFLKYLKQIDIQTSILVISNGAASINTIPDKEVRKRALEYNAFGILKNGRMAVRCDLLGVKRILNLNEYGKKYLDLDNIEVLKLNEIIESKNVSEFGEVADMDYPLTYGPNSQYRKLLFRKLHEKIIDIRPDIIITHGSNGEYGHYLHIVLNLLVKESIMLNELKSGILLFTAMPEFNADDKISHFLNLERHGVLDYKWKAIKSIPEIYEKGRDFDKPWDPLKYPEGVFMKDYGYSPLDAKPPKYEFYSLIKLN